MEIKSDNDLEDQEENYDTIFCILQKKKNNKQTIKQLYKSKKMLSFSNINNKQ